MKTTLLSLVAVGSLACAQAESFRSGSGNVYPPTKTESVLVFYDEESVKRPFEVIGEIDASDRGWGYGMSELVKRGVSKAAQMGAHAIIVRQDAPKGTAEAVADALKATKLTQARMTAIRFTDQK